MLESNWFLLHCLFSTRLPADFFDESEQNNANKQFLKGPGPSLLSGNYDDDDEEEEEEEEQDQPNTSSVMHKTEIPPPTREVIPNCLPTGNGEWSGAVRRSCVVRVE